MKATVLLFGFLLSSALAASAAKITPFVSIDELIQNAKSIVAVECISADIDDGLDLGGGRYRSRVTVIKTLKGATISRDLNVHTNIQLAPGTRYLLTFYSNPKPEKSWAYDALCAVRLRSEFSAGFDKMPLKEQVRQIFADRLIDAEDDLKRLQNEKASLEKATK